MPCSSLSNLVRTASNFVQSFFAPVLDLVATAKQQWSCPSLSDQDWFLLGVRRALEHHPSGRSFLQQLAAAGLKAPERSHFFETLKSKRRLAIVEEVSHGLAKQMELPVDTQRWRCAPEAAEFELYAG